MLRSKKVMLAAAVCLAATIVATSVRAPIAHAHCQIPCGIYGDQTRFVILAEHITTIEKSMNMINELSEDPTKNANQLVRWVMNKEDHADEIATIVTEYFLQQRIKPEDAEADHAGWMAKVVPCHELLVLSMKAKQTTDLAHVEAIRESLNAFAEAYLSEEDLAHLREHHHE